jgi:DNA-binding response OmpR family regulator
MLVASGLASERELLRECAAKAAFPVDYIEASDPIDPTAIRNALTRGNLDFVFIDTRVSRTDRQGIYGAARIAAGCPLVVFLGPEDLTRQEILGREATADGALARPFNSSLAVAMINCCVRARLAKRVLIVDESPTMRAVIRKVLSASRFRLDVSEAPNGKAAAEQASRQRFDLVLFDHALLSSNGAAALSLLRRGRSDLPIVITGTHDARLEERARAVGAADYLFKPFYVSDVDGMLRRLLGLLTKAG